MKNNLVSFVIPTSNGQKLLAECLPSVYQQNYNQTEENLEVIVVDNGSQDNTKTFVKKNFPKTTLVEMKELAGFSVPVNTGIRLAKGEYIVLLNNDVVLEKTWLSEMLLALKEVKADFAACKMLTGNGEKIDSAGDGFSWWGRAFPIGKGKSPNKYQKREFVFGASGGASIFKSEVFGKIGLLDEDFYAYFEDIDLSFRAQLAGFKCVYEPKAIAYHKGSASFGADSFKKRFMGNRNKDLLILKNYPLKYLIKNLPKLVLVKLKSLYTDFEDGFFFAGLLTLLADIYLFPRYMVKRKQVQGLRSVDDRYLEKIISSGHPKLNKK